MPDPTRTSIRGARTQILLSVDKEQRESELVAILTRTGYDVWATSPMGGKYLVGAGEYKPAVAIIEIGFCGSEAIDAIEELRQFRSFAIIALVDDNQDDAYHLLEHIGVDACLSRQVFTPLLVETVGELIAAKCEEIKTSFTAGPVWLDPDTRRVKVDSRDVRLTDEEFALLNALAAEPFGFNAKEKLVRDVMGVQAIGSSDVRRLERLAKALRKKLAVTNRRLVVDELGLGWRLLPASLKSKPKKYSKLAAA